MVFLLEILESGELLKRGEGQRTFQPFLRFWWRMTTIVKNLCMRCQFQPFLRFWGLCVWLLWVF